MSGLLHTTAPDASLSPAGSTAWIADHSYLASFTGAVTRTAVSKLGDIVSPKDFGAIGDGTSDDKAALKAALQSRGIVDGGGLTYGISGSCQPLTMLGLRNIILKQLTPSTSNCRTLFIRDINDFFLDNVKVDCGGDQANGDMNNFAGIWIDKSSSTAKRFVLRNCHVYNGGPISGIAIINASQFEVTDCVARDFTYNMSPDPTDDVMRGFWFNGCSDFKFTGRAYNFTGTQSGSPSVLYTRGIAVTGCSDFTFTGCVSDTADQCYDITGTTGNHNFTIANCIAANGGTHGFKFANSSYQGRVTGCLAVDIGRTGFNVAGMTEVANPNVRDITFSNCHTLNIGSNAVWGTGRVGFQITASGIDATYPRNIKFIGCGAIDTQASPTMDKGFSNAVAAIEFNATDYDKDYANSIINCWSTGLASGNFQTGFHFPVVAITNSAVQSINDSTWTSLNWDTDTYDSSALHNTSSTNEKIFVKEHGYYLVTVQVRFATNATGSRNIIVILNGVQTGKDSPVPGHATIEPICRITTVVFCVAGDNLAVQAWQDSGGALNVDVLNSSFSAMKVA